MAPSFQNVPLNQPNVAEQGLRRQRVGVVGSCSCQLWDVGVKCLGGELGSGRSGEVSLMVGTVFRCLQPAPGKGKSPFWHLLASDL